MLSNQLRIDTLLNKKDTNIHVIRPFTAATTTVAADNGSVDFDMLLSDATGSPDASNDRGPCHEHLCSSNNISDDVMDSLFDDIDYDDLFDSEPLPLVTEGSHGNAVITSEQQHGGSCDHNGMSCDTRTVIEIPDDDDDDDDVNVTDLLTVDHGKYTNSLSFPQIHFMGVMSCSTCLGLVYFCMLCILKCKFAFL